jgi:hypothetical protein
VPLTPTQTLVASFLLKLFAAITPPLVAILMLKSGQAVDAAKRKRVLVIATVVEVMVAGGLVYYTLTIAGSVGVQLGADAAVVAAGAVLTAVSLALKK